jgi:5-methylcytosine-specific restriction endonuclease McrA
MAGHSKIRGYTKAVKDYKTKCLEGGANYCYFCGDPIDMELHHNDRWAFSVQHITPISRGGSATAVENMAPAHRRCNAKEGARLAGTAGTDIPYADVGPHLKQSRVW